MINSNLSNYRLTKRIILLILILWIILAFFVAFFDLEISKAYVDFNSNFGKFIKDFGEIPGYIVIIISIMFNYKQSREKNRNIDINIAVKIIISFLILILLVYKSLELIMTNMKTEIILVISIILIITFQIMIVNKLKLSSSMNTKMTKFVRSTFLLAIISPLLFVQSFKILWGRIRFRDLLPSYENFTPWYLPQGINGNKSFPSGHTSMGWMILPILILFNDVNKKIKVLIVTTIILWGVLVAIGRVIIGAHYASDTLFSACFTSVVYLILDLKYEKNKLTENGAK